jgi:transposase
MDNTSTLTVEITTGYSCKGCPFLAEKDAEIERLRAENASLASAYKKLEKKYRRTKGAAKTYQHLLYGQSSEKSSPEETAFEKETDPKKPNPEAANSEDTPKAGRKRGAQTGHKGHGRKIPDDLPVVYRIIEVPEEERFCPICGQEGEEVPLTEESSEIDGEIILCRLVTKRKRIKRTCGCSECEGAGPRFVTAPKPAKAIPKSKFSHNLLALFIVLKFMFSVPLNRVLDLFALQGQTLSAGSVSGAFRKCLELFEPLYQALAEESRREKRWNVDETSWMSFIQLPGKKNYLTWMWVFVSPKIILYIWDPSRSSRVPLEHLGQLAKGFLTADRYGVYKKLVHMVPGLTIAFCWVHFRRDFLKAAIKDQTLRPWAKLWEKRIGEIFRLNKAKKKDPALQKDLEKAISNMEKTISAELLDPALSELQRKVLRSAQKHWEGLTVFVAHPQVPMDNNIAEHRCVPWPWAGTITTAAALRGAAALPRSA